MHLTQAREDPQAHRPDETLAQPPVLLPDVLQERAPFFILHHHVDGLVGAKKVEHPDHVGVVDARERPPFLEETLQPEEEGSLAIGQDLRLDIPFLAPRQGMRQILLDRHRFSFAIAGAIDERKPPFGEQVENAVALHEPPLGQRSVLLCRHGRTGYDKPPRTKRGITQ